MGLVGGDDDDDDGGNLNSVSRAHKRQPGYFMQLSVAPYEKF